MAWTVYSCLIPKPKKRVEDFLLDFGEGRKKARTWSEIQQMLSCIPGVRRIDGSSGNVGN